MANPKASVTSRLEELEGAGSTPYSKEIMSIPRLKTGGENDPNYLLVQHDLETTQHVGFVTMLKAMIMMKRVREDRENDTEPLSSAALEAYGINEVNNLIREAVDFCNDPKRSRKTKDKFGEALQIRGEAARYQPLVVAFNSILVDFRTRNVGSLERYPPEDETLYTVNDFPFIESSRLANVTEEGTKCKPDICEIPIERLLNPTQSKGLEDDLRVLARYIETCPTDWGDTCKRSEPPLAWSDVVHCIDVKASKYGALTAPPPRFAEPYTVSSILESTWNIFPPARANPDTNTKPPLDEVPSGVSIPITPPQSGAQKRAAKSPLDDQPAKRTKSEPGPSEVSEGIRDQNPPLRPEIQCAFYGIELLRASWDKTHSIVTLISNHNLSVHWYDSQGSISTDAIDIIEQLPLLVALVVLFQRFKKPMRGMAGVELEMTLDGEQVEFRVPDNARTCWALKGRRPFTCVPAPVVSKVPESAQPQDPDELCPEYMKPLKKHFLKWSWREDTRDSEADIIALARERAAWYLGGHQSDVLNHIPDVEHARDYGSLSTTHIRKYSGLDATKARVPSLMISNKLSAVEDLDRGVLMVKIWEILRCTLLLWRLGIAHCDISLNNIMVNTTSEGESYMVLNDFDLAAIMDLGDASPKETGFERIGTKPFMAIELLSTSDGTVNRLCRHDLESIIWVFVWMCLRDEKWTTGRPDQVASYKAGYGLWARPKTVPENIAKEDATLWKPVMTMSLIWMTGWTLACTNGELAELKEDDVLDAIRKVMPCPEEYNTWDWANFRVL